MQEIDLKMQIKQDLFSFKGYSLLVETDDSKARAGIYIKNDLNHQRRTELEGANNGLLIIDLNLKRKYLAKPII